MKRRLMALALLAALCLPLLAGCGGKKLPQGMDEEALLEAGREIVSLLNQGSYQEVYDRLRAGRSEDLRRRQTCVGPHRDDVAFSIEGRDARSFGSQGQQRTVALAVKMAEVALAEELLGSRPLLLLDDVMSELDEARRDAVMSYVRAGIQTVVTTTNLGYFSSELLDAAEVIRFGG